MSDLNSEMTDRLKKDVEDLEALARDIHEGSFSSYSHVKLMLSTKVMLMICHHFMNSGW